MTNGRIIYTHLKLKRIRENCLNFSRAFVVASAAVVAVVVADDDVALDVCTMRVTHFHTPTHTLTHTDTHTDVYILSSPLSLNGLKLSTAATPCYLGT